jgi:hypothetical protein
MIGTATGGAGGTHSRARAIVAAIRTSVNNQTRVEPDEAVMNSRDRDRNCRVIPASRAVRTWLPSAGSNGRAEQPRRHVT